MQFLKKISQLAALGAIIAITCFGCVLGTDQYGRPVGLYPVGVVTYPADVYPYYWGGSYYYPYRNGSVWVYNVYSRPHPNWNGPSLRHSGPPPNHWQGGGHNGGFVPGQRQNHPRQQFNAPRGNFQSGPAPAPQIRQAPPRMKPQLPQHQVRPATPPARPQYNAVKGGRRR